MHSPAERRPTVRIWLERAAHALALAIVVWFLIRALRPEANDDAQLRDVNALTADLVRWSTVAPPPRVHLTLDTSLAPATRDWLAAIAAAGALVTWEGEGVLPTAAAVEPVADPAGGTRIWTAAPAGAPIVLEDGYGVLDSTSAGVAGARFTAQSTVPDVKV